MIGEPEVVTATTRQTSKREWLAMALGVFVALARIAEAVAHRSLYNTTLAMMWTFFVGVHLWTRIAPIASQIRAQRAKSSAP